MRYWFSLQQRVERKGVRAIVTKISSDYTVGKVKLTLSFVGAGCAQPLKITHDQWIVVFETLRVDTKGKEQFLQKIGGVRPFLCDHSEAPSDAP